MQLEDLTSFPDTCQKLLKPYELRKEKTKTKTEKKVTKDKTISKPRRQIRTNKTQAIIPVTTSDQTRQITMQQTIQEAQTAKATKMKIYNRKW